MLGSLNEAPTSRGREEQLAGIRDTWISGATEGGSHLKGEESRTSPGKMCLLELHNQTYNIHLHNVTLPEFQGKLFYGEWAEVTIMLEYYIIIIIIMLLGRQKETEERKIER